MSGAYAYMVPYGMLTPAHKIAMRVRRFMEENNVKQDALAAVAMASYHHAQFNPNAIAYGKPLTREIYDNSRWIVEPFHLFDCCMENDGAVAILVTQRRACARPQTRPVYITAAAQGMEFRNYKNSNNAPDYASSNYKADWTAGFRDGRDQAQRYRRGAELRPFQRRRGGRALRARLLRSR